MRIISGKHKGIRIPVRKGFSARPTTDFAKENLFNILNNNYEFEALKVLDLFGGTGSISFEFASRGAYVDLVEKDYKSVIHINNQARKLGLNNLKTWKADVFKILGKISECYDIIFADPPYNLNGIDRLPDLIFSKPHLTHNGVLIMEHSKDHDFSTHPQFHDLRKYGSVHFSFFK